MPNTNPEEMKKVFASLDALLKDTDISDVTSETSGFADLPDGYYLSEVVTSKIGQSSKGDPMISMQFKTVEDGLKLDEKGNLISMAKTKGRTIFKHFPLKDDTSVRRFVADMLKFEGEKPGEPILGKEYFLTSEVLADALEILEGSQIYIHLETNEKDGQKSQWGNLVSWKVAAGLKLPE